MNIYTRVTTVSLWSLLHLSEQKSKGRNVPDAALDPAKLGPILVGPGGALFALLAFIGWLINDLRGARKERDDYRVKYEAMKEQRDEFRFIAADAVRTGKRSGATATALDRVQRHKKDAA
jgi:hypothetical protein